ncbi:hypothetical protein [Leisingera sp. ANG-S5]|uniref:hypothetical protein n=1 Tax=Leisingera sp. ANG-S5 TaxID=1577901 RepID=UPI00126A6D46|nr:hypothetical protein [Leisingera sp. ANG-S5]
MAAFFATQTVSQELSTDLSVPTNRYVRDAQGALTLTRWEEAGIKLDIVGDVSAKTAFSTASYLETLSNYAETKLELVGSAEEWFAPGLGISAQANYVVLFEDLSSTRLPDDALLFRQSIKSSLDGASPKIQSILDAGLTHLGTGCYGKWNASAKNVIAALIMVVDSSQPSVVQQGCLNYSLVSSLGVHPVTAKFEFDMLRYGSKQNRPDFSNDSEIIMLLQLSAYCREVMATDSLQCPADLYGLMLQSYKEQIPD